MTLDLETKNQTTIAKQSLQSTQRMTLQKLRLGTQSATMKRSMILADISASMSGEKLRSLKAALNAVWSPVIEAIAFNNELFELEQKDVDYLKNKGGTYMRSALQEAWQRRPSHIILATDGDPTDADDTEILDMAMEYTEIPIDTIGIGQYDTSSYNPDFLRRLSEITGGTFTDVGQPIMLTQVMKQLLLDYNKKVLNAPQTKGGVISL